MLIVVSQDDDIFVIEIFLQDFFNFLNNSRVAAFVDDGDGGIFLSNFISASLEGVEVKNIFSEILNFTIIADTRNQCEGLDIAKLNVRDFEQAIFVPRIQHNIVDIIGIDFFHQFKKAGEIFRLDVGFDIVAQGIKKIVQGKDIQHGAGRKNFIFRRLHNLLLSFGAAEITFRIIVSLTSIFERGGTVQAVKAFGQLESLVTIIRSGIARVINISFTDNVDAANVINSLLETVKIHHYKIINI